MSSQAYQPVLPALTDEVKQAQWGSVFRDPLPSTEGAVFDVLNNDQIPGYPQPVGINLFRSRLSPGPTDRADVHAIVTYGSGGVSKAFKCDWQGQFSLVCSSLRITGETYAVSVDGYTVSTKVLTFGATIGLGAVPSGGQDPITYTSGPMSLGASNAHEVVDFARRYFPMFVADPLGTGVAFTSAELAAIAVRFFMFGEIQVAHTLSPDVLLHGLPIPPGSTRVELSGFFPGDSYVVHHFKLGL